MYTSFIRRLICWDAKDRRTFILSTVDNSLVSLETNLRPTHRAFSFQCFNPLTVTSKLLSTEELRFSLWETCFPSSTLYSDRARANNPIRWITSLVKKRLSFSLKRDTEGKKTSLPLEIE